jgi:hypothetical protein
MSAALPLKAGVFAVPFLELPRYSIRTKKVAHPKGSPRNKQRGSDPTPQITTSREEQHDADRTKHDRRNDPKDREVPAPLQNHPLLDHGRLCLGLTHRQSLTLRSRVPVKKEGTD